MCGRRSLVVHPSLRRWAVVWMVTLLIQTLDVARLPANGPTASSQSGVLTWNNGDTLSGKMIAYSDGHVRWHSNQFSTPLEIHSDFLASLAFKVGPDKWAVSDGFRVETSTGDVVFGELVSIDGETVVLDSSRLGRVELRREYVREVRQLKHTQVVYDGPRWLDGWTVLKAGRRVSEWEATEHGFLRTEKYGGELYHDLPELDVAEINLVFRWSGKPGFQVDFSAPSELVATRPKPRLSIKSWGDDVVAQSSLATTDFQHLMKLADRETELRLRLVWDNLAGEVTISGAAGRPLGRIVVDKAKGKDGFGILIKNRSDDLIVEQVRLSRWNGASRSEDREDGTSYVRLASGKLISDVIESYHRSSSDVQLKATDAFSIDELAVAEFIPTGKKHFMPQHVRFEDGTEFSCEVLSIDDKEFKLHAPISKENLTAVRRGLESIRCFQGRTNEFEFHLVGDGNRLSGNLRPVRDSLALGWAPIGSRQPVGIEIGEKHTIERRMGQSIQPLAQLGSEVIYFRDDTVVIGEVKRIDEQHLALASPYTDEQSVPVDEIKAIEMLQGSGRVSFTDPGWEFMRSTRPLQRAQEHMEVADPISIRDLTLPHRGKITFSVSWDKDFVGLLTLHLGTSRKQPRNSIARFTFAQERLSARCLMTSSGASNLPPIPDRRATISLEANDRKLSVWVNGIRAFTADTKSRIEDTGLWIQCGSARGALSTSVSKGKTRRPRLVIERLRIGDGASRLGAGFASASELEMMLRLPRNRASDAPQAMLCSANGDLLRGNLLNMDFEQVAFESRYEEVLMPRSEVSALVWFQKTDQEKMVRVSADQSVRITSRDGSLLYLSQPRIVDEDVVGTHRVLGICRLPLTHVLRIQNGDGSWPSSTTADWRLEPTAEPKFVDDTFEQGTNSPLIGTDVRDVVIPMLDGGDIRLGDEGDKIVVLDFWASWCAPCIRSLPKLIPMLDTFPQERVKLIAVNQAEAPFTINTFLASRDLTMNVGLDAETVLARQFGVKSIPHTVIVGNGKVERVFVGAPADLHESIYNAVTELLPPAD